MIEGVVVLLLLLLIVVLIAFVVLLVRYARLQRSVPELAARTLAEWQQGELLAARRQLATEASATATVQANEIAQRWFEAWRDGDLEKLRSEYNEMAKRSAQNTFDEWKAAHEELIRRDAIDRSRAVIVGKVTEHVVPFMPAFTFNPKDARFVGSPIDLIVFDGMDAGDVNRIVLIEVKTGSSALSKRERQIRDAIKAGRVEWQEMRVPTEELTASIGTRPEAPKLAAAGETSD